MFYRRELKVFDAIQKQIHTRVSPNYNIKNFDCSDGIITDDTLYLLTYSKFLFIHIPKTAGSSLNSSLVSSFKKPKLLNHYEITPYTSEDEVPINYTINKSIDFGFGIKKLIFDIKKNEKDDNL